MRLRPFLCLLFGALGFPLAAQTADVVVAVDAGRFVQPIVRVSGGSWRAMAGTGAALPRSWLRVTGPGAPASLRTIARAAPCGDRVVLDVEGAAVAAGGSTPTFTGLAIAGMADAADVTRIAAGTRAWTRVEPHVRRLAAQRAREQRLTGVNVDAYPLTIDAIYTTTSPRVPPVFYFEAAKTIPDVAADVDPDDPRGTLTISLAGWIRPVGETFESAGTQGELHWDQVDDRGRAPVRAGRIPLGALRIGGTTAWVFRLQEGTTTSFTVYNVTSRVELLARVGAAGC